MIATIMKSNYVNVLKFSYWLVRLSLNWRYIWQEGTFAQQFGWQKIRVNFIVVGGVCCLASTNKFNLCAVTRLPLVCIQKTPFPISATFFLFVAPVFFLLARPLYYTQCAVHCKYRLAGFSLENLFHFVNFGTARVWERHSMIQFNSEQCIQCSRCLG